MPRVSVIVPVLDEAGNVVPLLDEISTAMQALAPFEVIFIDDASRDETAQQLQQAKATRPWLRVLQHERTAGQSRALRSGIMAAQAPWIARLDGDGQNDPADLPQLLQQAWQAAGGETGGEAGISAVLVAGQRTKRQDNWRRRLASKFANKLRSGLLRDNCPDSACGVKVHRREDWLMLPFFSGIHRYEPALFLHMGAKVLLAPVHHRPRGQGVSKYTNWRRAIWGLFDLFGVAWLIRRTPKTVQVTER